MNQLDLILDIGGTFIKYALLDANRTVVRDGILPTQSQPTLFLQQLQELVDQNRADIGGISIAMGGFIDPSTGENTDFSVGENFRTYNLKQELSRRYQLPVCVENDSNCALLGEVQYGAGQGHRTVGMVTIGTGIGGAMMIEGNLHRGTHHKAGEVGLGWMGEVGATAGFCREAEQILGFAVNGKQLFDQLEHPLLHQRYVAWLGGLAQVIGTFALAFDPSLMLIGGGISENQRFLSDLRQAIDQRYPHLSAYTQVTGGRLGNQAGIMGAFWLLGQERADNA